MEIKGEIQQYNGFKLISLELRDNTLLGKGDISYSFIDGNDNQKNVYSTIIIGANGTGKSNLFRIIIELFKELYDLSKGGHRSYYVDGRFNLKFSLHGNIFQYSNIIDTEKLKDLTHLTGKNPAYLLKDEIKVEFVEVQLPIAIVANSIMLTDKFPVYNREDVFPNYKYLGVRNRPQNASTRSYVRKTVEFIVQEHNSDAFRNGLAKATKFLGLDSAIEIFYYTSNTVKFFKADLTYEKLDNYFQEIKKEYPNPEDRAPYKLGQYLKLVEDKKLIEEICDFCNGLFKNNQLIKIDRSSAKKIEYNIIDDASFQQLKKDFSMLEHLRQLGMISAPEIQLKRASGYSLQESSSGEYHFFSSIVGLMATVKTHSLVLIDEPEVSLHPNWQMQYLSFIRELFSSKEYATSHILIATHSHFLISDLRSENSKIIGLKRENEKIEIVNLPENLNTYGWSAEHVLLDVFRVPSTRNIHVAEYIGEILKLIAAEQPDKGLIQDKLQGLKNMNINNLKSNDPLKTVVDKLLNKIEN
jgi:predicted ATPase